MNGRNFVFLLLLGCIAICFGAESGKQATPLTVISRSQWGAKKAKGSTLPLRQSPAPFVVIHHSDSDACTTQAICQARVRNFQNYHMNQKGWNDIGYNFLVGEDGNIYEGRGWGVKGSHSVPFNSKSIGICFIGNFSNRSPNSAAIRAATRLIEWGVSNGKIKSDYKVLGHRQTTTTTCPGDRLYSEIQTWSHWSSSTS